MAESPRLFPPIFCCWIDLPSGIFSIAEARLAAGAALLWPVGWGRSRHGGVWSSTFPKDLAKIFKLINWFQWISMDFNGSKDLGEHFRKKSINWFQKSFGHFSWWNINIFKGFQKKIYQLISEKHFCRDLNGFHQTLVDFIDISSIGGFSIH